MYIYIPLLFFFFSLQCYELVVLCNDNDHGHELLVLIPTHEWFKLQLQRGNRESERKELQLAKGGLAKSN